MRKKNSNFFVGRIALISALLFSSVFLSCNNDVSESHETSFTVTIDQDLQNYVYSDKDSAKQGETVTLTTQAYNGKEVSSISVRTTSNTEISCLPSAKSMYTFIMPNTNVVITGVLKTVEGREIVIDIKVLDYANESDNSWLMEQAMSLYKVYYSRSQGVLS